MLIIQSLFQLCGFVYRNGDRHLAWWTRDVHAMDSSRYGWHFYLCCFGWYDARAKLWPSTSNQWSRSTWFSLTRIVPTIDWNVDGYLYYVVHCPLWRQPCIFDTGPIKALPHNPIMKIILKNRIWLLKFLSFFCK